MFAPPTAVVAAAAITNPAKSVVMLLLILALIVIPMILGIIEDEQLLYLLCVAEKWTVDIVLVPSTVLMVHPGIVGLGAVERI